MRKIIFTAAVAIAVSTVSLYASSGNPVPGKSTKMECKKGMCPDKANCHMGTCPDKPGCICH